MSEFVGQNEKFNVILETEPTLSWPTEKIAIGSENEIKKSPNIPIVHQTTCLLKKNIARYVDIINIECSLNWSSKTHPSVVGMENAKKMWVALQRRAGGLAVLEAHHLPVWAHEFADDRHARLTGKPAQVIRGFGVPPSF